MLTAHSVKILKSLDQKKFRQKYNLFLVEGNKIIKELANSDYETQEIFSTNPESLSFFKGKITEISPEQLRKISFLKTPKDSVAVCKLRKNALNKDISRQLILDGIQDPGNLGTMIRLADWFGIRQIVCSEDTADFYNPKVVQASMGSFLRVNVVYENLEHFLKNSARKNIGTDMSGTSVFKFNFPEKFNLIFGNEGNGIRPNIEKLLDEKLTIPRFGKHQFTESLNVSVAAGIVLGQAFLGSLLLINK
ncbi:MAG: RNA methyltransferase [Flavobacteriaceae bacterium]|jgi:TrmH family RNA methyltransferase|nr:RNA methyltransferase [Flavobacteriaceae bacterium]